ncbi:hypothetical protein F5Y14DRAFT_459444, partial [Nemania sp. NC0429]
SQRSSSLVLPTYSYFVEASQTYQLSAGQQTFEMAAEVVTDVPVDTTNPALAFFDNGCRKLRMRLEHKSDPLTLTTFPLFGQLPTELRLDIWDLAMDEQQIASLTEDKSSGIDDDIKYGRLPAFLFVSYECRMTAIKRNRYPIRFSFRYIPEERAGRTRKTNPEIQHAGVQICAIGPEDIVALRVEGSWDDANTIGPLFRFQGEWGGNYKEIRNWMMPSPLIPNHPDPEGSNNVDGRILFWWSDELGIIFYPPGVPTQAGPDDPENVSFPYKIDNKCYFDYGRYGGGPGVKAGRNGVPTIMADYEFLAPMLEQVPRLRGIRFQEDTGFPMAMEIYEHPGDIKNVSVPQ